MSELSLTAPQSAYRPSKESLSDRNPYRYTPTLVVLSHASARSAGHVPKMDCYLAEDGVGIIIKTDAYGTTIHSGTAVNPRATLDAQTSPFDYHIYPHDSSFEFYPHGIAGSQRIPISELHRPACICTGNGFSCILTRRYTHGPYPLHPSRVVQAPSTDQTPWTRSVPLASNSLLPARNYSFHDSGSQHPPTSTFHNPMANGDLGLGYFGQDRSGHQTDSLCYQPPPASLHRATVSSTNDGFPQGPHSGNFNNAFGVDNNTSQCFTPQSRSNNVSGINDYFSQCYVPQGCLAIDHYSNRYPFIDPTTNGHTANEYFPTDRRANGQSLEGDVQMGSRSAWANATQRRADGLRRRYR